MKIKARTTHLAMLIGCIALVALAGCAGDDDSQASSTIQGNVSQVFTAMDDVRYRPTRTALWRRFFSWVRTAHAQGGDLSGIVVTALLDGQPLDTAVTDSTGQFVLEVPGGDLVLTFTTETFELTLALTVPDESALTLTVTLNPNDVSEPVVVEQMAALHHPVRCTSSDQVVLDGTNDLIIDGDGGTCIHATGSCTVSTNLEGNANGNILLTNCERCLQVEGTANVSLTTSGAIRCEDATEHGIWARGHADINVEAGETIEVSAQHHGIDASGTAVVSLQAQGVGNEANADALDDPQQMGLINITGETGINASGNATVELDTPGICVVEGTAAATSQVGNAAIVMECTPQP